MVGAISGRTADTKIGDSGFVLNRTVAESGNLKLDTGVQGVLSASWGLELGGFS
jgi:hypothetical protein